MEQQIKGVEIKKLKFNVDERGMLMEILRRDDNVLIRDSESRRCKHASRFDIGQVYMTTVRPQIVKAWHYHEEQDDFMCCVNGTVKLVLYDNRDESSTLDTVNVFYMSVYNPILVKIPHGVYHGFMNIGDHQDAIIINCPNVPYNHTNPDEYRIDPHENQIPYNWEIQDG
jgi:dTDP-4-dehydrorhamnose 3,5-epimerase